MNKSERQCGDANHIFGHVGCHAGGFFGQDTQTIPVSATFSRKTGNLVANSLGFFMKTWTKLESGFKRSEKVTPSGFVPSK